MSSIFAALESASRALAASQEGLEVSSQNIANASTDGYTRQRLVTTSVSPDLGGSKFLSSQIQVGGGVEVKTVEQIRNNFLDNRYRSENANKSMYDGLSDSLSQLEDIVNEFDSGSTDKATGLSGQISSLVSAMQKLQGQPDDTNLASTVQSAMDAVCQIVRSDANQLDTLENQIEGDLKDSVGGTQGNGVNAIVQSISSLNKQIQNYEVSGQTANDLRDQRNNLLDELSGYADISVTQLQNGLVTVALKSGTSNPYMLIDSGNSVHELKVGADNKSLVWDDNMPAYISGGSIGADLEVLTGDGTDGKIGIPATRGKLDAFAQSFTQQINTLAKSGSAGAKDLLSCTGGAETFELSSDFKNKASLIIDNYSGTDMGNYVSRFIDLFGQNGTITYNDAAYSGTIQDFTDSISLDVSKRLSYVKQIATSSDSVVQNLKNQRQSASGVSIDEEGTNIIRYMQSYSAAAKVVSALNEMISTLMNAITH